MTLKTRLGRPSPYTATAATLLGFLLGSSATWASHAGATTGAAHVTQHTGAVTRAARPAAVAQAPDFSQTLPPDKPSAAIADTEYSTRLYGNDPYQEAVAVTRHVYTASQPLTDPNEKNTAADRPWGLTLVTPDDPIAAISAVELVHFPDNAPILFVNKAGIPAVTLNEIKLLTDSATALPSDVTTYLQKVAPTFLVSPGDGPYNMLYIIGNYNKISWNTQVSAELSQEMGNRHDTPGGSIYIAPR